MACADVATARAKAAKAINLIISSLPYDLREKDFSEECITHHQGPQFKTWSVVAALKRRQHKGTLLPIALTVERISGGYVVKDATTHSLCGWPERSHSQSTLVKAFGYVVRHLAVSALLFSRPSTLRESWRHVDAAKNVCREKKM